MWKLNNISVDYKRSFKKKEKNERSHKHKTSFYTVENDIV